MAGMAGKLSIETGEETELTEETAEEFLLEDFFIFGPFIAMLFLAMAKN